MICLNCGKAFEPRKVNARYCSDKCRSDASNKRNYNKNRSKELQRMRDRRICVKVEVLTHYSPDGVLGCCWEGCSVSDIDMLSLDHINNDGAKDRKANPTSSTGAYFSIKNRKFPLGFQTLCWNHQWKKELTRARDAWID